MASATRTRPRTKKLATLPEEPWGRRLKRGREDFAEINMEEAVQRISYVILMDKSTLSRLEQLPTEPIRPRQRMAAYALAVAYGLDPGQFGLTPDDVPPGILRAIREQGFSSTKWKRSAPTLDQPAASTAREVAA